jgi:N-terminal half of MaoC dehydratase
MMTEPLAPPTFTVSLEWPLVGGPEPLAAIGVPGNELFRRLLHTFQDSRFHRPVRVGSRLRLEAVLASVSQTKSGALAVTRIRTVDARSDEAVAESWFGAYFRDTKAPVPCCALQHYQNESKRTRFLERC